MRESAALPRIVDPAFAMSDTERPAIPPVAAVHLLVSNRPRVLLLTTYYAPLLGGVETHARQLATHLRAHGFGVQIVTKRVAADHPGVERIDDIVVHRVSPTGERRGAGKWLATPFMLRKILELRDEFDVLVCVDYRGIGLAAVVAGRWLRRPVLVQAGTAGALAGPTRLDRDFGDGFGWQSAHRFREEEVEPFAPHVLFWLSLVPFTTGWMGENHFTTLPVALYGVNLLLCAIAYTILTILLVKSHGPDSAFAKALGRDRKGKISLALYVIAIAVATIVPRLSMAIYVLVAAIWLVPDRRFARIVGD